MAYTIYTSAHPEGYRSEHGYPIPQSTSCINIIGRDKKGLMGNIRSNTDSGYRGSCGGYDK